MWCALIEEITARAKEMAGEKEMAYCIKGYHEYKDIEAAATREVLVCGRWRTVVGKNFVVQLYSCKIFSYVFCVRKYFCNEKKRITVHTCTYTILHITTLHQIKTQSV